MLDTIRSWDRPTIEEAAAKSGATYVSPPGPWDSFTVTDGRIVTGANPASAHATAVAAVEAFKDLDNHDPKIADMTGERSGGYPKERVEPKTGQQYSA